TGHDVQLTWPAGQNGNGYAVGGVANGSSSNCTGAVFANLTSVAVTGYLDTGRYSPQGSWYCYQVQTTYSTWTSATNPSVAAQLGFVASSVQLINDGNHLSCTGLSGQQYGQA